jgi:hypothetical protein
MNIWVTVHHSVTDILALDPLSLNMNQEQLLVLTDLNMAYQNHDFLPFLGALILFLQTFGQPGNFVGIVVISSLFLKDERATVCCAECVRT